MGNELVDSFKESISSDFREIAGETSEVILDSFLNEGLIKDIPIIKYLMGTYDLVNKIRGLHYISKLQCFFVHLNKGIAEREEVEAFKRRIIGENARKEVSYILVLIDRY